MPDIHPQGSSRATGGILRGKAASKYYHPDDDDKPISKVIIRTSLVSAKIYLSDLDPKDLDLDVMVPSTKVKVQMDPFLGPILQRIAKRFPSIKGKF